jgi:hypothetical protein
VRRLIFLCILTVLVIAGCAKASDPTDSSDSVLTEVTSIPLNGNAYTIDYSDSYIAVAEYDSQMSIIDRNTFERTWFTEIVGVEGSVYKLGRNRRINLVEELNYLLVTEEKEADSYKILDITSIDTLQILGSVTGGTYNIQQIEIYPYDDPEPTDYTNYSARGFFIAGSSIQDVGWNLVSQSMVALGNDYVWNYPINIYGAEQTDDYMFAAAGQRGIFISDNHNYNIITEFDTPGQALKIEIRGNYAYIACRQAGLYVYDISDINNPVEVYNYDTTGYAQNLDVNDNYIVLASGGGNLYVFNNTDPTNISFVERETSTGYTNDVKIDNNNRIYVATRDNGLMIFDFN